MKPPRLAELQRQRELVREHLAWLDREIAAALARTPDEISLPTSPAAATSDPLVAALHPSLSAQPDPASVAAAARRGCFIFAALAALLFATALAGIYFMKYRDRPLLFVEERADHGIEPRK